MWFGGDVGVRQDLEADMFAHAVAQQLRGLGQRHVFQTRAVDRQQLVSLV